MEEVYNYLIDFGFKREDIDEIVNNYSLNEITPTNLLRHIKSNCEYLLEFGYTEMQIIKMAKIFPMLFGCSIENIKRKIEDIESLGYSKKEVIIMTIKLPSLFGYNFESIKQKIEYLISLGYTREQVIKIIKVFN